MMAQHFVHLVDFPLLFSKEIPENNISKTILKNYNRQKIVPYECNQQWFYIAYG